MQTKLRPVALIIILFAVTISQCSAQFTRKAVIKVSPQPETTTVADFNNDGIPDLAVDLSFPNAVAVLLGGEIELENILQMLLRDPLTVVRNRQFDEAVGERGGRLQRRRQC